MRSSYEFDGSVRRVTAQREAVQTPCGIVLAREGDDVVLAPDGAPMAVIPAALGGELSQDKPARTKHKKEEPDSED